MSETRQEHSSDRVSDVFRDKALPAFVIVFFVVALSAGFLLVPVFHLLFVSGSGAEVLGTAFENIAAALLPVSKDIAILLVALAGITTLAWRNTVRLHRGRVSRPGVVGLSGGVVH